MNSGLDALATFQQSPPGIALWLTGHVIVFTCIISESVTKYSVSGTRRRYEAATVFQTLLIPSVVFVSVDTLLDAAEKEWLGAATGVALVVALIIAWHRRRDDDSWWKGKGTKLKKKLTSFLTSHSPAAAGAGAGA